MKKREKEDKMKRKVENYIISFIIRVIIGITLIFFINQFLEMKNIDVSVGINRVTTITSGILGVPGVGLLYGIEFYQLL